MCNKLLSNEYWSALEARDSPGNRACLLLHRMKSPVPVPVPVPLKFLGGERHCESKMSHLRTQHYAPNRS